MKILLENIFENINKDVSKDNLSSAFFQLGHEHLMEDDYIDFELTPNRGDCLSVQGLLRDLNVLYETNHNYPIYENEITKLNINFKNFSEEDCPSISFLRLEIEDETKKYKDYMENYFSKLGVKKNNFFTDVSNYVLYELGQPTHCYDAKKINNEIIFDKINKNIKFTSLLNDEIELDGENCVFISEGEVINLAGIMGGLSSACSRDTKTVLVECAFFNPKAIIGKSTKYKLNSDAAYRFERGVDIDSQEYTLRRFIKIVEDHAHIKKLEMTSFNYKKKKEVKIENNFKKINSILGTNITQLDYQEILKKLNFSFEENIIPPSYRNDITNQNDIAEEIARSIGYNSIKNERFELKKSQSNKLISKISSLKSYLASKNFNEVINIPFESKGCRDAIIIDNPLDSSKKYLRTSLKESLVENLLYNERRQKDSIKLFEVSNVYRKVDNKIISNQKIALIVSGRLGLNYKDFNSKINKDYLRNLLNEFLEDDALIQVEEISRENLNSKSRTRIYYAEVNLAKSKIKIDNHLKKTESNFPKYIPISEQPSSNRDFSFLISKKNNLQTFLKLIGGIRHKHVSDFFIFDFYENNEKKEIKVGVRLVFQSRQKTLSDMEIREITKEVLGPVLSLDGIDVPGLEI